MKEGGERREKDWCRYRIEVERLCVGRRKINIQKGTIIKSQVINMCDVLSVTNSKAGGQPVCFLPFPGLYWIMVYSEEAQKKTKPTHVQASVEMG